MVSTEQFVQSKIKLNKIVVFSATYCKYSTKAKNVLRNYDLIGYEIIELNERPDFDYVLVYLAKISDESATVPKVFINGQYIGGGNDTETLHNSGELRKLLLACGAIAIE